MKIETVIKLYKSLVRPLLEYALQIWIVNYLPNNEYMIKKEVLIYVVLKIDVYE